MSRAEDDLTGSAKDYAPRLCELGTVGWAGQEEVTTLGTADNDGLTFVRVTLYAGKTNGDPVKKGVAQGREILCALPDGVFRIPKRGARAYVLFPAGMEEVTGAGVIVATVSPGNEIRKNVGEGDTIISATGGGQACIVIKKNGSIVFATTDDNTPTGKLVSLTFGPTGYAFDAPIGSQVHDATGWHLKTKAGPRIDMGGVNIPGLPSDVTDLVAGYCTIRAPKIKAAGAVVMLGVGPVYATTVTSPSSTLSTPGVPITTGPAQSCSVLVTTP